MKHILVTGAVGKVGAHFIHHILQSKSHKDVIRALCHNRVPEPLGRLEIVKGNISDRETVRAAMKGITHVIHCATCKETADDVIDVTVKGLFWLLEECRASSTFQQIILIGGDAGIVGAWSKDSQSKWVRIRLRIVFESQAILHCDPAGQLPVILCIESSNILRQIIKAGVCFEYSQSIDISASSPE